MIFLAPILWILCVGLVSNAIAVLVHAGRGVGCININGAAACEQANSVWDWVYVMPPSPFFCDNLCSTTVTIEFGFNPFDRKSIKSHPRYRQEFIILPTDQLSFTKDYCLVDVYNGITTCFDPKNIYQGEDATNPYHALRYTGPSPYPAIQTERKHVLLPDTGSDTISAVPNVLDNLQSD